MKEAPPSVSRSYVILLIISFVLVASIPVAIGAQHENFNRGASVYPLITGLSMLPFVLIPLISFIVMANKAFCAAVGDVPGSDKQQFRTLRGVHLGLNLSGIFIFPIFTCIGVPVVLIRLHHRRTKLPTGVALRATVALGASSIATLLVLIVLLAVLGSIPRALSPPVGKVFRNTGFGESLLDDPAAATCAVLLAVLHVFVHVCFIAAADKTILRALAEHALRTNRDDNVGVDIDSTLVGYTHG
jgi:hypothetical protein